MPEPRPATGLDRGALVVTPNKRLSRDLVARHDERQRAAGRRAWPSARALPWDAFVGQLWQAALDRSLPGLPPVRLDAAQAGFLWRRVVARDLAEAPLVDVAAAAALAAEAWERAHAYGAGGEGWRGFDRSHDDVAAFVRWAEGFEREVARAAALDPARAADALALRASALPGVANLDLACEGFLELSPQQRRLLDALAAAGARVDPGPAADGTLGPGARRFAAATPRDELLAGLAWARERAEADPRARVGLVVHDLAQSRDVVRALAEDVLCPGLLWPGSEAGLRPYDLSAGDALDATAVAAGALDLVALAHGPLDVGRAAALLRSPHLPGDASDRARRSALARRWIDVGRREVGLRALVADLAGADASLAQRWRGLVSMRAPARATPRGFADFWRGWLEQAGWCGSAAATPAEREARGAWNELLAEFARLAAVAPPLARADALAALREAASRQAFQAESPGSRIRILGLLEAAGLSFDALWVVGLTADAWPRPAEPSPLLPYAWQRERGVPRATPARELAYARLVTAALSRGAPEVVFSHAERIDDHPVLPSPLIEPLPAYIGSIVRPIVPAHTAFGARPALAVIADDRAPAFADGVDLSGGAGLLDSQSACPFQATARHRLRAEAWPEEVPGLPPQERGRMVHAALAAFWREVGDQRTLLGLADRELAERIAAAVEAGRAAVEPGRWDSLPPVVAAGELDCTTRLLGGWLALERERPPFRVAQLEQGTRATLAGHAIRLRIDRVDATDDGRAVLVDYKTGAVAKPARWFDPRPQAPQLALYAASEALAGSTLAGLAYAQVKPGRLAVAGIASDAGVWPLLASGDALAKAGPADWDDAVTKLRAGVEALAAAVHEGDARIAPRERKTCTWCECKPLCRIAAADEAADGADGADENGDGNGDG